MSPLSTAHRFADERNTHRVILERALDDEHACNLLDLLELRYDDIVKRYAIGSRADTSNPDVVTITFVDGSIAACNREGRWTASAA